jgi:Outer membrane receptor proteins, mostly Fe transport
MKRDPNNRFFGVLLLILLFSCGVSLPLLAQSQAIKGNVSDEKGESIIGASILVKGTTNGVRTDTDGNFQIQANKNATLVISYIGYMTQELAINGKSNLKIVLKENNRILDEVVVMGYGVQKKKLATGATAQVKGSELQKLNTVSTLGALQGQAPGVRITSTSGHPGADFKVVIRGLGTTGNSSPLYIVDGVQLDNISFLNNADIESIDVLKDAASAAIYGNRAANGVVLITTKKGKVGEAVVSYDGYYGVQNVYKKIDMLDAQQYAAIMNEMNINAGGTAIKFLNDYNIDLDKIGKGTDWFDKLTVKNAMVTNHNLAIQGGTDKGVYAISAGYTSQDGIIGGHDVSNYERINFRINTEFKVKSYLTVGQHLSYSHSSSRAIGTGNGYDNTLAAVYSVSPFRPIYGDDGKYLNSNGGIVNGKPYNWNVEEANPVASMYMRAQNKTENDNLLPDLYAVLEPIKNLKLKTSIGLNVSSSSNHSLSPAHEYSLYDISNVSSAYQSTSRGLSWLWENTASYDFKLDKNAFSLLTGTSASRSSGASQSGSNIGLIFNDFDHAWLDNTTNIASNANFYSKGSPWRKNSLVSYFGRILYNFDETYLLNATFRADGSSKFAKQNRWGYFPSVSAGWVISNEAFMKPLENTISSLKLRASWGQNGNEKITSDAYLATIASNENYFFGPNDSPTIGSYPNKLANPNIKWEVSEQSDFGLDLMLFNKLNFNIDYYIKTTKDWLVTAPVLATAGASAPLINGGDVRNKGVEAIVGYRDNVGKFNFNVSANMAYNKNEVTRIANADKIIYGSSNYYRAEVGHPIGYFWGYTTKGIFQNDAQIKNYTKNGKLIQPDAVPGDVIFLDRNNDGVIDDNDRSEIGKSNPDFTFGLNLSADYYGFDFSMALNGVLGNDIVLKRGTDRMKYNWCTDVFDRWHGEGTSNSFPRVVANDKNGNWTKFSDLSLHDGSYLRASNITLGYDFTGLLKKYIPVSQLRLYISAQNLFTITSYRGMDPEVGYADDSWASGIDIGTFPHARTYMFGLNLKF